MKKIISLILCVIFAFSVCITANAVPADYNAGPDMMKISASRHIMLYDLNGRTITITQNASSMYLNSGWYDAPVVKLYNSAGETSIVYKSDVDKHVAAGWHTTPVEVTKPTNTKKAVALTFDDGPSKYTARILNCLSDNGGKATFFVVGPNVLKFGDTLRRAHALGMEIGNHTVNHANLRNLSQAEVRSEINTNADYVEAAIGVRPKLVRPPYGNYNDTILATANTPFILWSIDTLDWKTRDTQKTVDSVLSAVKDGDIILMHDLYEPTAAAAEIIIPELIKRGFDLVTVSELAERKGVTLGAKAYRSIK